MLLLSNNICKDKSSETTETIPVFVCIVLGVSLFCHEYSALLSDSVIIVCPHGSTSCVRPNISGQIISFIQMRQGVKTLDIELQHSNEYADVCIVTITNHTTSIVPTLMSEI